MNRHTQFRLYLSNILAITLADDMIEYGSCRSMLHLPKDFHRLTKLMMSYVSPFTFFNSKALKNN